MWIRFLDEVSWNRFMEKYVDEIYLGDLKRYENWKREMGILKTFWCGLEERLKLIGVVEDNKIIGVARILKIYDKWRRYSVNVRGDIQDIYLSKIRLNVLKYLLEKSIEIFRSYGLNIYTISEWKKPYWRLLRRLGYSPYARSIIIGWNTSTNISLKENRDVEIKYASKNDLRDLRSIQRNSWRYFIPPDFDREDVLIAYLDNVPVGSAYLNKYTGCIDFGVHVNRKYWRKRIGTALIKYALKHYREKGFERMYVVRVLRLMKINLYDYIALNFYINCGGKILREYLGFRIKKLDRVKNIPSINQILSYCN